MIDFPMTTNYVYHWGHKEAAREIISNAIDAEKEFGSTTEIKYYKSAGRISVVSNGTSITRRSFFLGETSKVGSEGLIGKFGEGLTLSCLVLARQRLNPKVISGGQEYIPYIEDDVFKISENKVLRNRNDEVVVSWECTHDQYLEALDLFIRDRKVIFSCDDGDIVDGTPGDIYVKGVKVSKCQDMKYSYNLKSVSLGRDRDAIDYWTIKYNAGTILQYACEKKVISGTILLQNDSSDDVRAALGNSRYSTTFKKILNDSWVELYPDAMPVTSYDDVGRAESYNIGAVVVSKSVSDALDLDVEKEIRIRELLPRKFVQLSEMGEDELNNLNWAVSMCNRVVNNPPPVAVVEFNSDGVLGTYDRLNKTVNVARKIVNNKRELLTTVVHEMAHRGNDDNVKGHFDAQLSIMVEIIMNLLERE